jgi:hypothetical protein
MPPARRESLMGEYMAFSKSIRETGQMKGGEALQPTRTATTVRMQGGKLLTTDGPFAETREQLGGFYLVEAKDLDEARAIAARIPSVAHGIGCVEIRPTVKF